MKVLILIAHGSRISAANQEIIDLAQLLQCRANKTYSQVVPAFLELADPSIPDAIQQVIDSGANEVVLLPYFLASGKHVETDIPSEVEKKQLEHPHIDIKLLDYFGRAQGIDDILLKQAGC